MSKKVVVKPIKTAPEKNYIGELMLQVIDITKEPDACKPKLPVLPDLYDKPEKEDVITQKYTRFRS